MCARVAIVVVACFSILVSVVSPVGAQEPGGIGGGDAGGVDQGGFDPSGLPPVPPLPGDGEVPGAAQAAAEGGFGGSSIEPGVADPPGVMVTGPQRVDGVAEGGEMAPAAPASSQVPQRVKEGLDDLSGGDVPLPAALAPGRRFRFEPETDPAADGAVALSAADAGDGGLPGVRLVRPESDRSVGLTVSTLGEDATAGVSNVGLGMVLELDRAVGGGQPLSPPGLSADRGRPDVELGARSGWELHVDLDTFAGVATDVWAVEFRVNVGCNPVTGVCQQAQVLPSSIDEEAGVLVVELPANVLASLARPAAADAADAGDAADAVDGGGDESALGLVGVGGGSLAGGVGLIGSLLFQHNDGSGIVVSAVESAGNYSVSRHESLAAWQVGLQTGHAELTYAVPVPPGDGYVPSVAFSYSSGAVDGMNRATNAQGSKIGVGWSESEAVITRATIACDNKSKNLCPASGNRQDGFSLSFNGVAGPLVRTTDGETGVSHPQVSGAKYWEYQLANKNDWRIRRVEQVSGGPNNGDAWRTWWEITTGDGTLFVFGREQIFKPTGGSGVATLRPRGNNTSANSQSLQTIPMYFWNGTRSGVDCGTVDGYCQAGLAWHLDQVIDTSGNQTTYRYSTETNRIKTKVNGVTYSGTTVYDRDLALDWIDYGQRFGDNLASWSTFVPYRVNFVYGDRKDSSGNWVDTPTNLDCSSTSSCAEFTPSFYSKKKMTSVGVYVGGSWKYGVGLSHSFPVAPGESGYKAAKKSLPKLWLDHFDRYYLGRTTFTPVFLENRVNYPDDVSPMRAARVETVRSPSGGIVTFTYGQSHPPSTSSSSVCYKGQDENGPRRPCDMYPAYDAYTNDPGPVWWHKWKVTAQTVNPRWGGSQQVTTTFRYVTPPQWAHVPFGYKATGAGFWNDYRGHREVEVIDAAGGKTKHFFFTGMAEDKNASSSPAVTAAKNPWGGSETDSLALRGRSLGTIRFVPNSSYRQHVEVFDYSWTTDVSKSTANVPPKYLKSTRVTWRKAVQEIFNDPASWSKDTTEQQTSFDWMGRPSRHRDIGLRSTSADDFTTFTTYRNSSSAWIYSVPTFVGSVPWDTTGSKPSSGFMSATAFEYDSYGRTSKVREQYRAGSSGPSYVDTTFGYDYRGRPTRMTEYAGSRGGGDKTTTMGYNDTYGYRTWENGPLAGDVDKYSFQVDPTFGAVTRQTDPNGRHLYVTYDQIGRVTTVREPGAPEVTARYSYGVSSSGVDWVKTEVLRNRWSSSAKWIPTWEFFDGIGRSIQTQERHPWDDNKSGIVSTRYDNVGRVYELTEPRWVSTSSGSFRYEDWYSLGAGFHRYSYPSSMSTDQGCDRGVNTKIDSYNSSRGWWSQTKTAVCGLQTRMWDREYKRTALYHDARGNVTKSVNPAGDTTTFQYNERGDLTKVYDHYNNKTEYQYWSWEGAGPNRVYDPDRGRTDYVYDGHGRVRETTDARGVRLIYDYDNTDRPTRLRYAHSSGWLDVTKWSYDNGYGSYGMLYQTEHWNRATDGSSKGRVAEKFFYDSRYRVNKIDQTIPGQSTRSTRYTYLDHGAVEDITHPNGQKVERVFDRMGRVTAIDVNGSRALSWVSYNERGQIGAIQRGVDGWGNDLRTDYTYDHRNGNIASADTQGPSGRIQRFDYTFTRDNQLTKQKESGAGGTQYLCANYDNASRLTRAWTRTDGNCGNTSSNWSGPEPFQNSYSYNRIGNITSGYGVGTVGGSYTYSSGHAHAPSGAGGNSYTYDAVGNRTRAVVGGQATNSAYDVQGRLISTWGAVSAEHLYTAGGERARRTVNGTRSWYYRDGYELNNASEATISVTLNGMLVASYESAGGKLWSQAADHLGTPTVARSWHGDQEIRRNTPYGSPRSSASTVAGGPSDLSFTGQRDDAGTGLLYYGARFYDPVLGQFTQPDTIVPNQVNPVDWNRYMYVRGNPLRYNDPTGHCPGNICLEVWGLEQQTYGPGGVKTHTLESDSASGQYRAPIQMADGSISQMYYSLVPISRGDPETGKAVTLTFAGFFPLLGEAVDGWQCYEGDKFACVALGLPFVPGSTRRLVNALQEAPNSALDDLAAAACRRNSFVPGTLVLMADGSSKPIEDIEIGDWVWATDPETGETGPRQVVDTIIGDGVKQLVDVDVLDDTITATGGHPFWVADDGAWIDGEDLDIGDRLLLADGRTASVTAIDERNAVQRVHNLTVDGIHTYYVQAGDAHVLVHNCRPEAGILGSKKHGVSWTEGPARARSTGLPQGQWAADDLALATDAASGLGPRQSGYFDLPAGSQSVVHMPDGTTVQATRFWVRNNGTGTWHGYPMP